MSTIKVKDAWGQATNFSNVTKLEVPLAEGSGYASYYEPAGTMSIATNGTYDVAGWQSVMVDVAGQSGPTITDVLNKTSGMSIVLSGISSITSYFFNSCKSLTLSIPDNVAIGNNAFNGAGSVNLTLGSTNTIAKLDTDAFANATLAFTSPISRLTITSLSSAQGTISFYNVSALYIKNIDSTAGMLKSIRTALPVYIENTTVYGIPSTAFQGADITEIHCSASYGLDYYVFRSCPNLSIVDLPNTTTVGVMAFQNCQALSNISMPAVKYIYASAFWKCINLEKASFSSAVSIYSSAFTNCLKLSELHIGTSNCTLSGSAAFNLTPMINSTYLGYFGSIYVPSDYVSTYQSATNWVYLSSRITAETET